MDHCTFSPDGSWAECCARHDRRYENKRLNRSQADELLRRCIKRKSGNRVIGRTYWIGVRIFGWFFYDKAKENIVQ